MPGNEVWIGRLFNPKMCLGESNRLCMFLFLGRYINLTTYRWCVSLSECSLRVVGEVFVPMFSDVDTSRHPCVPFLGDVLDESGGKRSAHERKSRTEQQLTPPARTSGSDDQ